MLKDIVRLSIVPIHLSGQEVPEQLRIHVTDQEHIYSTLFSFIGSSDNKMAWIILTDSSDSEFSFLKKFDGTVKDSNGHEVIFSRNLNGALSVVTMANNGTVAPC